MFSGGNRHEHRQHLELAEHYPQIAVAYTQMATIATDDHHTLQEFWGASESGDIDTEHAIYAEDAILDYPKSGERFRGRSKIHLQVALGHPERLLYLERTCLLQAAATAETSQT